MWIKSIDFKYVPVKIFSISIHLKYYKLFYILCQRYECIGPAKQNF